MIGSSPANLAGVYNVRTTEVFTKQDLEIHCSKQSIRIALTSVDGNRSELLMSCHCGGARTTKWRQYSSRRWRVEDYIIKRLLSLNGIFVVRPYNNFVVAPTNY